MLNLLRIFRLIEITIFLFLVVTPIIFFTGNNSSPFEIIRAQLVSILAFVLFIQWLIQNYKNKNESIRCSVTGALIHGLTLAVFISYLFSINAYLSFWGVKSLPADSLRLALYTSIFVFVIDQFDFDLKQIRLLFSSLNLVLLIQIIFGLLQVFKLDPMDWAHQDEIFGTSGNTIKFAILMGTLLVNALYFFLTTENKLYRYFIGILIFLGTYLLFLSGSRATILVTLAALSSVLIYFFIGASRSVRIKIFCGALLISAGIITFSANYQNSALQTKMSDSLFSQAISIRKHVGDIAFQIWKENPIFGSGPETFVIAEGKFHSPELNQTNWRIEWSKAHNSILHALANTGIAGALLLISLFFYLFYIGVKLLFSENRSDSENLSFSLIVIFSLIFIANLTCFYSVYTQVLSAVLAVFAGKLLKLRVFNFKFEKIQFIFKVVSVLGFTGVLTLTYYSATYWYSDIIYQKAVRLREIEKDSKSSFDYFLQAADIFPYEPYYYCGAAHAVNDLLMRNHVNLDSFEKVRTAGIIDNYVNDCLQRAENRQHLLQFAANIYLVQFDMKFISEPKKALNLLERALKLTPQHPDLYFRIGLVHFVQGNYSEFEANLKTAIQNKADYIPAYIKLTEFYFKNSRISDAKKIIGDALQIKFVTTDFVAELKSLAEISKSYNDIESFDLLIKKLEFENNRIPKSGTFLK